MGRKQRCSCKKVVNIYNISIHYGNKINNRIKIIQKAESGGMINRHVGFAATQGGQNAAYHSRNEQIGERNPQPTSSVWFNKQLTRRVRTKKR
ncbi:hypothetical protein A8990_1088 [Paenibacillus taihuensis]|uniref:Uncharacterized protein n=1 Tax=Paenibacillus taihuensis TaxID=1156355 RepID=A0A3D9S6P8_9BACL|nr:hypothetical protein [Paenibacillus taihuensis]REE88512.1 hypothetical protein A8990_1088 [Paenibacillus taihuensis]